MSLKSLLFILLFITSSAAYSQRSRVQIHNGTLVTDKGTLLRGATDLSPYEGFVWQDIKEDIKGIKNLGLNSLHFYAESADVFEPGQRAVYADSIVKWTRENSLYLILTVTWHRIEGIDTILDIEFMREFWSFYASRYKDETHVVFEICNEPNGFYPYDSLTLKMEREMYDTIRSLAPETHIIFMSGFVHSANLLLKDVASIEVGIDWSNASIAAHGYGSSPEEVKPFIDSIWDAGYPLIMTEFHSPLNEYANLAYTRIFEEKNISYLHFVSIDLMNNSPNHFKSRIESSEIRWVPDFGTWPESLTEINFRSPYSWRSAIFYDEGYGIRSPDLYAPMINYISHNDYIAFYDLDFGDGPMIFEAECTSDLDGGLIEIRLDSINGVKVGECLISSTGGWVNFETFSCSLSQFDGVHSIYLIFIERGSAGLFDLKRIRFLEEDINLAETQNSEVGCFIYPNPANEYVTIRSDTKGWVEIYNFHGQLIINGIITELESTISIHDLPPGKYLIRITNQSGNSTEKLIVNKQ